MNTTLAQRLRELRHLPASGKVGEPIALPAGRPNRNAEKNSLRLEYAAEVLTNMAAEAVREGQSGTIGVEIPVKDGKLGRVKCVHIVYQDQK